MSVHRLRAITDDGTFAVDIDADRARLRSETEPQARNTAPPNASEPAGIETTFQITPVDAGILSISGDSAPDEGATPLRAYVAAIEVESAERARPRRGSSGNEGLAAPMPATVIKVLVEPGAEVHRGDVLLLLEAMKMELPVRAPRDGRVKALHCRPGELVQPGTALVDLE